MQYQLNNQPLRLQDGIHRISCLSGALWLTFIGDEHDYFIHAGEQLDVTGLDGIVISAVGYSAIADVELTEVTHLHAVG